MAGKWKGPFDPMRKAGERAAIERRMDEARQRLAETRAAMAAKIEEMQDRMAEIRALERLLRADGRMPTGRKPFRRRQPPKEDGGEPVPAVPRPKPTPLAGGAAAPLDPDRRTPVGGKGRRMGLRKHSLSDADSRLGL